MSLNAQALRLLAEKGLSAADIVEVAEALEVRRDRTAAERMRRYRAKKEDGERVTVTRNVTANPSPNDNISNPLPDFDVSNETSAAKPDFAKTVEEAWNRDTDGTPLPKARQITGTRLKHLRCRVKDHGEAAVLTAIRNMAASDFHSGRSGKWTEGNLGWLLKSDDNFQKMLERSAPVEAKVEQAWTPERMAEYRARVERLGGGASPPSPPERREASSHGKPIGQLIQFNRDAA